MTNFSRRSFLKTSGAGVAATLGGFATTSMAQTPAQKFDKEADVIVVGLGGAGAATAITAADNGASVIVIERQPLQRSVLILVCPAASSTARTKLETRLP